MKLTDPGIPDIKKVLRYAGSDLSDEASAALARECLDELSGKTAGKVSFAECDLSFHPGGIVVMGELTVTSKSLARHLSGCDKAVIFAATAGIEIDRLIIKYERLSPVRALMMDAAGTALAESICDMFCKELSGKYKHITARFSPGYGDLSLEYQKDIFRILDCGRQIGLSMTDSLLMTPTKSVTAIVGVKEKL